MTFFELLQFFIAISILIFVHEWGHFFAARAVGIGVDVFALGFGPKLFSKTVNGTEYCICAIPLGGYIKPVGEDRSECTGELDEFYSHPPGHRAVVALSGPVTNFLLAYVCFYFVFLIGYVDFDKSMNNVLPLVQEVVADTPAQKAGLMSGDKIVRINSENITNWNDLHGYISSSDGKELNMIVERNGEQITKVVSAQEDFQEGLAGNKEKVYRIGITAPALGKEEIVIVKHGPLESFKKAFFELSEITQKTYVALFQMFTGRRSLKEAMGIVGIAVVFKNAAAVSFVLLLHLIGLISASLAIFNLLPFPILDGGHLVFCAIEKIRNKPLSEEVEEMIMRVGFTMIICLALFIFYADFERIGWISKFMSIW